MHLTQGADVSFADVPRNDLNWHHRHVIGQLDLCQKATGFWEGTFRREGHAGSHVTSQLATDLSTRQVNARITPRVHIAVSVSISMIKHREIERGRERKRGKKEGWRRSDLNEGLLLKSLSAGLQ